MLPALTAGLLTGLSLIVAIGAQNAFVLRQGLRRDRVGLVVAICALSDVALILAGVAGIGALVERAPLALEVVRWLGVAFLTAYGVLSLWRARHPGTLAVDAGRPGHAVGVAARALALTWLNPHVYLDTVVLLGSVAAAQGDLRWHFGAGAAVGSLLWFSALGAGARLLRPVFARPGAWRVLDAVIAVVMVTLAIGLLRGH